MSRASCKRWHKCPIALYSSAAAGMEKPVSRVTRAYDPTPERSMLRDRDLLIARLRDTLAQLAYLPRTLVLIWGAAQSWTLAWAMLLMLQGSLPVVTVYLTRLLIDSLVAAIGGAGSWESVRPVLAAAALMAGALLLTEFLQSAIEWIRTSQAELVQDYMSALVHKKAVTVDLAYYESPEYYDRLDRARGDASSRSLA